MPKKFTKAMPTFQPIPLIKHNYDLYRPAWLAYLFVIRVAKKVIIHLINRWLPVRDSDMGKFSILGLTAKWSK